jgi:hypothetical protein
MNQTQNNLAPAKHDLLTLLSSAKVFVLRSFALLSDPELGERTVVVEMCKMLRVTNGRPAQGVCSRVDSTRNPQKITW